MKTGMAFAAVAVVVALAACSKREDPEINVPGAEYNKQTGILTTKQGLQLNATSAVGSCISPEDARRPVASIPREQRVQIVSCLIAQTVEQMNPQLPRQVDQITRLDRVSAAGPVLTYYYTVSSPASSLGPNAARQIETQIRGMACRQPSMRQTMEMGGAYAYRYVDNQGQPIHSFQINGC